MISPKEVTTVHTGVRVSFTPSFSPSIRVRWKLIFF